MTAAWAWSLARVASGQLFAGESSALHLPLRLFCPSPHPPTPSSHCRWGLPYAASTEDGRYCHLLSTLQGSGNIPSSPGKGSFGRKQSQRSGVCGWTMHGGVSTAAVQPRFLCLGEFPDQAWALAVESLVGRSLSPAWWSWDPATLQVHMTSVCRETSTGWGTS